MLTRSRCTRIDDQRKNHIDPKRPTQRNIPKQLQTRNVPIYYVENTNGTNKGRNLRFTNKPQIIPRGTERILQVDRRYRGASLHILNESTTRRKNLAMAWIDYKKIWYGSPELDNKLPQNVQDNRWSYKLYRENHENLESGIDNRREKFSWSGVWERYIPGRRTITITICISNDATQPYTQGMHRQIQT